MEGTKCSTKQIGKKFIATSLVGLVTICLKISIFIGICAYSKSTLAQVVITGKAQSYAKQTIEVFAVSDFITNKKTLLTDCKVDNNGNFKFLFRIEKAQKIFISLPKYMVFMYVQPDKKYQIKIPKFTPLKDFEKINPYWTRKNVSAYIVSSDENLNHIINKYNFFLNYYIGEIIKIKNKQEKKMYFDTISAISDTIYEAQGNFFFNDYKKYSMGMLKFIAVTKKKSYFIDTFFYNKPILMYLTPYVQLFDYIFENYFEPDNDLIELKGVYMGLQNHNFLKIVDVIENSTAVKINKELAKFVALKGLYDKFYKVERAQNDIIQTVQNIENLLIDDQIKDIAKNMYNDFTKIRKNYPVYNFTLKNKRGKKISLNSQIKDKFVYINFVHYESGRGLQHFQLLKKYNEQKNSKLEIITIFVAADISEMRDFLESHKEYKWTFLFAEIGNNVIKEYNIKSYPSYFFITPDGLLADNYTPTPEENFINFYNKIVKSWILVHRDNYQIR